MTKNKSLDDQMNSFLDLWDCNQMTAFLRDIIPLFQLYDVDDENDWVRDAVGKDDEQTVRIIRTIYLISRIAEFHASKLCAIKFDFKNLYLKMENVKEEVDFLDKYFNE